MIKVIAGPEKKSRVVTQHERELTAYHEAGHAVACRLLQPKHRIERVSILPASGGAAGYNLTVPEERALPTLNSLSAQLQVLLAGRAAEQLLSPSRADLTAGAANDLSQATELAAAMTLDLGLVGHPAVSLRALSRSTGASSADASVLTARLLADCYQAVTALLSDHAEWLTALAQKLLECESLPGADVDAFFTALEQRKSAD